MKTKDLTQKQKMFCLEYLKSFNWTEAYKKVYWWTDTTARVNASKLLTKTNVQEFLWSKVEKKVEKLDVWVESVLQNLQEIVEIGMGRQEIELKGKPQKIYDLKNVNSALEKLWKYHKMYIDKVESDTSLNINIISYKKWQK